MYKIGDTSGLQEKNIDDGKETIKIVGDVVDKMVKKCEDVPKKMTAPNKIMEITDGCFSSAQVIEVKDEKSSSSSSDSSSDEAAEEAAEEAAKTSGGCGGGRSSTSTSKDVDASSKSCCGGSSTQSTNQCTGAKLVDTYVPSTVSDVLSSGLGTALDAASAAQTAYMNSFCAYHPFPECATCPYGRQFYNAADRNLQSLFQQIEDAMAALLAGYYDNAAGMFICPGLVHSLMIGNLGPIAAVAGANAVAAIVSLTAARGALSIFSDIATSALYTDFRREIMYSVGNLLRSGSSVGIPGAFVSALCGVLTTIGCSANQFTRMTTRSGSSRSSRFGCGHNLWGNKCGTKRVTTRSQSYANNSKKSRVTGKTINYGDKTQKWETSSVDDAIPTVYKSSERQEPSTESVEKAEKAKEKVKTSLSTAKEVSENPTKAQESGLTQPTKQKKTYNTSTDKTAKLGKTYYKKDTTAETTVESDKYVKVEVEAEQPLETIQAKYGPLYEVEDNGVTESDPDPITITDSTKATNGKIYTYKDPATGKQIEVQVESGASVKEAIQKSVEEKKIKVSVDDLEIGVKDDPNPTFIEYKKSSDQVAQKGKKYYRYDSDTKTYKEDETITEGTKIEGTVYTKEEISNVSYQPTAATEPDANTTYYIIDDEGIYIPLEIEEGQEFPSGTEIFEQITVIDGTPVQSTEYSGDAPCVLENGLIVEEPVFLDMASQSMGLDTTSIITTTRVPAGEMARIESLGLSLYEIKMAYILDHERNGSVLPVDVTGEVVPTILDTIADND